MTRARDVGTGCAGEGRDGRWNTEYGKRTIKGPFPCALVLEWAWGLGLCSGLCASASGVYPSRYHDHLPWRLIVLIKVDCLVSRHDTDGMRGNRKPRRGIREARVR